MMALQHIRRRGYYIPAQEAQAYIELMGWHVLDDCPGYDDVLLAPPPSSEEERSR